jgi:threonine/homoserine/homoserine lactone efflux protein
MSPAFISLSAFAAAATVLTITPGLDTAFVLSTAASGGTRPAVLASIGIGLGCFIWAALVALGLGALLAASRLAYAVVRIVGAAYLMWTGYKLLRYPRVSFAATGRTAEGARAPFATGALTNLLNPKVGVFYVSFLPQFVPHGVTVAPFVLLLGSIHVLLGLLWFACLIAATRPIARWLRRPTVIRGFDRLTGALFLAFGVGLAIESRSR